MNYLPYRYQSPTGDAISFDFPLHEQTGSATRVHQLLDRVLHALNHEVALLGDTQNGDLLQALAMALAVRTELIPGDPELTHRLARDLTDQALGSLPEARHERVHVGNA
jgi:hypothetical protein